MSSASRGGERMIHQDFIARVRYSNALPPPPIPPKLLDVPNTGVRGGQYTTPGFASRLAREQPLNIEADAELGMPLDLVGMPGIFDGDESSIQAPAQATQPHPHDRLLLRPLSTLGKPKLAADSVSFLRRTEYISSVANKQRYNGLKPMPRDPEIRTQATKRRSPSPDEGSPAGVRRKIERSFDVATSALADPKARVRHPAKKTNLRLLDARPLLPDLNAFPDSGTYVTIRFTNTPLAGPEAPAGHAVDGYDTRLLSGIFQPIERSAAEDEAFAAAEEAYAQDPKNNPKPVNLMNYDYYLADSSQTAQKFRERFDVDNPKCDDDGLYTNNAGDDGGSFAFNRVRAYETAQESELNHATKYSEELVLAFIDSDQTSSSGAGQLPEGMYQTGVYYYPVMQRSTIRPQRSKNIARTTGLADMNNIPVIDQLEVTVTEPTDNIRQEVAKFHDHPLGVEEDEDGDEVTIVAAKGPDSTPAASRRQERGEDEDADGEEAEGRHSGSPEANGFRQQGHEAGESDDQDAEGDEDEE